MSVMLISRFLLALAIVGSTLRASPALSETFLGGFEIAQQNATIDGGYTANGSSLRANLDWLGLSLIHI